RARASSPACGAACGRSSTASRRSASTSGSASRSSASARSPGRPRPWSARARRLRAKRELVVVTNGLLVASALADAAGTTVLVTGGILRLSAMSLVGDFGTDILRTTRINKGFLGARGLSLERGLMDLNPDEVRIKQEM